MRRHLAIATVLIAALGLGVGLGHAAGPAPGPQTTRAGLVMPELQEIELANGLKVFVATRHHAPVVSLITVVKAGIKDEPGDQRGIARLVEGLMAQGSNRVRPGDHARLIESVGGTTSSRVLPDGTLFEDTVPRGQLPLALDLEADRFTGLLIRDEGVAQVKQELALAARRMDPLTAAIDQLAALAYTSHPYAWQDASTPELADLTVAQAKAFYDAMYVPSNAAIFIVGDISAADARTLVEARFGKLAHGAEVPRPNAGVVEPAQTATRRATAERPGTVGLVTMGWKIPPAKHADQAALKVAMAVLAGGETARLTLRLVKKDKLAPVAGGQLMLSEDPGLFIVYAAFRDSESGDKLAPAITQELARLGRVPLGRAELEAAKRQLIAFTAFGTQRDVDLAYQYASSWLRAGDPEEFARGMDAVLAVKPADVQRVVRTYLGPALGSVLTMPLAAQGGRP
jgi:zinc protease